MQNFCFMSDFTSWVTFFGVVSCSLSKIKFFAKMDCKRTEIKVFVAECLRCQASNLEVWVRTVWVRTGKIFALIKLQFKLPRLSFESNSVGLCFLIAALIFSAGYYSAPIFFYFVELFRFTFLPLFQHFAWNLFDFSRLVSLFSHSVKSEFEHQLLSKAIQNEQSQYKKLKSEIETG